MISEHKVLRAGNTGVQMGGWFNKKIRSANDFKGLKMRMPGLGGQVLGKLGGSLQFHFLVDKFMKTLCQEQLMQRNG